MIFQKMGSIVREVVIQTSAGSSSRPGAMETVAGTGSVGPAGDGGPATDARFGEVMGLAIDGDGNIYVAEGSFHVVRMIEGAGATATADFNGDGSVSFADFLMFAAAFGTSTGDAGFDAKFDLNGGGSVDFIIFAGALG